MIDKIESTINRLKENNTMNINKLLIENSDGQKSVTMTAFVLGFIVVNLKLILSGMTIGGFNVVAFTGTEYAVALTSLGAIYVLRRQTIDKSKGIKDDIAAK